MFMKLPKLRSPNRAVQQSLLVEILRRGNFAICTTRVQYMCAQCGWFRVQCERGAKYSFSFALLK